MGHIAHLGKQSNSINIYDYHNVNWEKKKPIIYFMRIVWFFIWTNLNTLHPRMLCAQWFWRRIILNSPMYFCNFIIISLWKRAETLIWINLNFLPHWCFVSSLIQIGTLVLEKITFQICSLIFAISKLSSFGKGRGPSFGQVGQTWIPFIQRCIVPNLVEIGPMVLEKMII